MNKKNISIFLMASLFLVSCGTDKIVQKEEPAVKKYVGTATIKKDYFSEQLKLIGKVSSIMETPVSPLISGTIKNISAEVGQKVKAGQVLATINLSNSSYGVNYNNANTAYNNSLNAFSYTEESIKNDLESARIQLENAKTSKDNAYVTTEKQLQLAQTQLDNVKNTVKNTISVTDTSKKNVEIQLKNAKDKLDMDKRNFEVNLSSSYSNLKNAIALALTNIDSSINYADTILGITDKNRNLNDLYETYLGAKDPNTKAQSEQSFLIAQGSFNSILNNVYGTDRDSLDKKAADVINTLVNLDKLYSNITAMLNNSISSSSFSVETISSIASKTSSIQVGATGAGGIIGLKTQLDNILNGIVTLKTQYGITIDADSNAINSASAALDNINAGNNSQLDSISGNENLAQTQLENTIALVKQTRDSVDNALKIVQTSYDSINAKLNSQKIQAKSAIDNAKGGKDLAGIALDNTSIVAPYDGVITARNIEIGSSANPGSPAFMIGNNDNLKIKLDINSDNITNLTLGQSVEIKKQENSYTGIISLLSPNSDLNTKMFKAEISFMKKPDKLNLGDFVDVYILKQKSLDKYFIVPFSSIISLGQGDYSIYVVGSGSQVQARKIKIGSQNSKDVIVTSGLNEGDKIVISGALNLQDGDIVEEK